MFTYIFVPISSIRQIVKLSFLLYFCSWTFWLIGSHLVIICHILSRLVWICLIDFLVLLDLSVLLAFFDLFFIFWALLLRNCFIHYRKLLLHFKICFLYWSFFYLWNMISHIFLVCRVTKNAQMWHFLFRRRGGGVVLAVKSERLSNICELLLQMSAIFLYSKFSYLQYMHIKKMQILRRFSVTLMMLVTPMSEKYRGSTFPNEPCFFRGYSILKVVSPKIK